MMGLTDVHQHVLYGIDDGADSEATMWDMLMAASRDHVTHLCATPHISPGAEKADIDTILMRFQEARRFVRQQGLKLDLILGAENMYNPLMENEAQHGTLFTLGSSDYVLVEFMPNAKISELWKAAEMLTRYGYCPIFAHVERYACLRHHPWNAARLKKQHRLLFQMNARTVARRTDGISGLYNRMMLKRGMIDCLGSDAHDTGHRRTMMTEAFEKLEKLLGIQEAERIGGFKML